MLNERLGAPKDAPPFPKGWRQASWLEVQALAVAYGAGVPHELGN
jgi:hypothetical protein